MTSATARRQCTKLTTAGPSMTATVGACGSCEVPVSSCIVSQRNDGTQSRGCVGVSIDENVRRAPWTTCCASPTRPRDHVPF